MQYQELLILLPCHSLDDFPTHHEGDEALGLLSNWTALWHPALIASAKQAPQWKRVEDPPSELAGRLILVPGVAKDRLPTGYAQRAKENGAVLIRGGVERNAILATALEPLGPITIDEDLAADFLALGYAFLVVQMLTRQMRYSSNLDEEYFKTQAVAAAVAAASGDEVTARERLSACFSLLAEERDRYYSVEAFLIDITMVAETTLGTLLRGELAASHRNVLASGELLEMMATREPETLSLLKQRQSEGAMSLIGGEDVERRLPLLSLEDLRAELELGREWFTSHEMKPPQVFGRRRFGLTPALPQVLHKFGYSGALHATLEDGRFPEGTQIKVGWEGSDGTAIDALARPPLDASQPRTFLQLATKLGESMDADHVATLLFAHWPGQASMPYGDLARVAKYSSCLGKFVTIDEYFANTSKPGQLDRFETDRYKSPYLKQAVIRRQPDPISSSVRYWTRRAKWESAEAMETLAQLVTNKLSGSSDSLAAEIVANAERLNDPTIDERIDSRVRQAAEKLAAVICPSASSEKGQLVINPYSCVRRTGIADVGVAVLPAAEKPIYAVAEHGDQKQAVVDVPGFGYVWIGSVNPPPKPGKPAPALAEAPNVLRNEFFEAIINPTTGALQSVHEYSSRRNRVSQQLAVRWPAPAGKPGDTYRDPDETAQYSVMAADQVEITCATTAMGEITVRGRLMNLQGGTVATYTQIFRVWRGSRVLQIAIEVDTEEEFKSDPWNSYLACRFAWGDEAAELGRTMHQQFHRTSAKSIEAPHYIDIGMVEKRTTLLTGGLPFHKRVGLATIDSLLLTRGESARRFTVGIGIDLPHPLHEAMALLAPPVSVPLPAKPPKSGNSGWLLHCDSRNVIVTHLAPLEEAGKIVGLRARILETAGRPVEMKVTAFKAIFRANKLDFRGESQHECATDGGKVKLNLSAHEWVELAAYFDAK